jgi:hypothetical protein
MDGTACDFCKLPLASANPVMELLCHHTFHTQCMIRYMVLSDRLMMTHGCCKLCHAAIVPDTIREESRIAEITNEAKYAAEYAAKTHRLAELKKRSAVIADIRKLKEVRRATREVQRAFAAYLAEERQIAQAIVAPLRDEIQTTVSSRFKIIKNYEQLKALKHAAKRERTMATKLQNRYELSRSEFDIVFSSSSSSNYVDGIPHMLKHTFGVHIMP